MQREFRRIHTKSGAALVEIRINIIDYFRRSVKIVRKNTLIINSFFTISLISFACSSMYF